MIRIAKPNDVAAMLAIYAPFIANTAVTFEVETPSLEDFAKHIAHIQEEAPCLVWEQEGEVLGYAYAAPHRWRAANGPASCRFTFEKMRGRKITARHCIPP